MATATKKPRTSSAPRKPRAKQRKKADDPMERLNRSIDAADVAVKDLRSGAAKGTRELIRDLERTLKHARTNAQRVGKAVSSDFQQALKAKPGRARRSSR